MNALRDPFPTVTAAHRGEHALVAPVLTEHANASRQRCFAPGEPLRTQCAETTGGHFALVATFLALHTVTSRDRFALVTAAGQDYAIADIGLRMLGPRELFRAQGFPEDYVIGDNPAQGLSLTKTAQVRMCGNSVCPPVACAFVAANVPELAREEAAA